MVARSESKNWMASFYQQNAKTVSLAWLNLLYRLLDELRRILYW